MQGSTLGCDEHHCKHHKGHEREQQRTLHHLEEVDKIMAAEIKDTVKQSYRHCMQQSLTVI